MTMVEGGMDTDAIAKALQESAELKHLAATEGADAVPDRDGDNEVVPREIRLIAQALAFSSDVTAADVPRVHQVLAAAYAAECVGAESFRGGPALSSAAVEALVADPSYRWVLVEAPNGHRAEEDGALLGACCYSTDGVSRKNGEVLAATPCFARAQGRLFSPSVCPGQVEGALGAVRFFGVLPQYHGLCIGRRLLRRVEAAMFQVLPCLLRLPCIPHHAPCAPSSSSSSRTHTHRVRPAAAGRCCACRAPGRGSGSGRNAGATCGPGRRRTPPPGSDTR
jgi:hypothetical protein